MEPENEPDRAPNCAHPRETYDLAGHSRAEQEVAAALESGRMHHGWLICGPRGVGKATLAYRIARRVLGAAPDPSRGVLGADPGHAVCRRIEALSHSDLMVIRRPWDESRKRVRAEITVEEARRVEHLFEQSAGEGGWRVVIVDSVDDMNPNAANALLKILEEPPKDALLLLISHAPGRLLPTIRSRCRQLKLHPLGREETAQVAQAQGDVDGETAALVARLAAGAPGRAAALAAQDAGALHGELSALLKYLPELDLAKAYKLGERLGRANAQADLALFHEFVQRFARERAHHGAGAEEEGVFAAASASGDAGAWIGAWEALSRLERQQEGLYLDAKQSVMNALYTLRDAAA